MLVFDTVREVFDFIIYNHLKDELFQVIFVLEHKSVVNVEIYFIHLICCIKEFFCVLFEIWVKDVLGAGFDVVSFHNW